VIAIDTNLLVRLLVQDDAAQSAAVETLLRETRESGQTCFISDLVLCELEWVLRSCYKAPRSRVFSSVQELLDQHLLDFEDRVRLRQVAQAYQLGKAELSDYLIGAKSQASGAAATYTFDRKLRKEDGFVVLPSAATIPRSLPESSTPPTS
jgi:predicted nucleic-acid-binding protein